MAKLKTAERGIESRTVHCLRCGYRWLTKLMYRDPPMCPECRDWYWNVPEEQLPATRSKPARKR